MKCRSKHRVDARPPRWISTRPPLLISICPLASSLPNSVDVVSRASHICINPYRAACTRRIISPCHACTWRLRERAFCKTFFVFAYNTRHYNAYTLCSTAIQTRVAVIHLCTCTINTLEYVRLRSSKPVTPVVFDLSRPTAPPWKHDTFCRFTVFDRRKAALRVLHVLSAVTTTIILKTYLRVPSVRNDTIKCTHSRQQYCFRP